MYFLFDFEEWTHKQSSLDRYIEHTGKRANEVAIIITSYTHAVQRNVQNASKFNMKRTQND